VAPRNEPLRTLPVTFAHRGARAHARENTLDAFRMGLAMGASGLESDAWLTGDGVVVLDHDGVVGGTLRRRSIASVRRSDLPGHIPSLAELYEAVGTDFELSLDVKDPSSVGAIVAVARSYDAEHRLWLCVTSLDEASDARALCPRSNLIVSTRLRAFSDGPERYAAALTARGADGVNLHASEWTGGMAALFHRFELYALGWDAQHVRILEELLHAGIDGVFSDYPERMVEAITGVFG